MYARLAVSDKRVRQLLFGPFESGNCHVARHRRKSFQELLERFATFEESKSAWTGTRVPRNTGVPPRISGSFTMMLFEGLIVVSSKAELYHR
jgi:hypothetical protein